MPSTDTEIARELGCDLLASRPVGGGCIHQARRLELSRGTAVFVKSASGEMARLLDAEACGLQLLAPRIRVPQLLAQGTTNNGTRWIALEWMDLTAPGPAAWEDLGRQLAGLHATRSNRHGLDHDNFIGATPQQNQPHESWPSFFLDRRLRPQLRWAAGNGHQLPETRILSLAEAILDGHQPPPSLLHGDLWSGNTAALPDASAVVFDPAPYFGDPETDLAMLELFGGNLPDAFLRGYGTTRPDRQRREPVYDLYHALNHLNLLGAGYTPMVMACVERMSGLSA